MPDTPQAIAERLTEADLTCVLIRARGLFGKETVICGQRIVEQYLRVGYAFDWPATDRARSVGQSVRAALEAGE